MLHCVHLSYWCPDGGHRRSCFSLWVHCWAEGFSHRRGFCCPGDVYSRLVKSSHLCIKYRFIQYRLFQSSFVVGRYCRWRGMNECSQGVLSPTINTTTEVRPLSKATNPQLPPGQHSKNGCPQLWMFIHYSLLCVCTWMSEMQRTNWLHMHSFPFKNSNSMHYFLKCLKFCSNHRHIRQF